MAKIISSRSFFSILALLALSACTEIRTIIGVFSNSGSYSMSAFEVDEMSSGNKLTCGIMGDRTVRCLGSGIRGSLGRFHGAPVNTLKDIKQIALGKGFTCAIVGEKNEVFCFGRNDKGQLGNSSLSASVDPVAVQDRENNNHPLSEVKQITAGENHACAVLKSGRGICWGDNSFGQAGNPSVLGIGSKIIYEGERSLKPFENIHEIVAGANSTCMIAKDTSEVFCFGERYGSTKKLNWAPEVVELAGAIGNLSQIKSIGVGRAFGCALGKSSQVYCWGANDFGQLGALINGPGVTKATQVQVTYPLQTALNKIDEISVGERHGCALHRDEKTVYCWGDNRFGQLGNTSARGLPEQVALGSNNLTLKGVRDLSVGTDRSCIISSRDEVFCWGNGADGILGSEKVLSQYPIRVLDVNGEMLGSVSKIAVGYDHTCVIDNTQKLFCFGLNEFGQLGSKMFAAQVLDDRLKAIEKVISIDVYGLKTCLVYGDDQSVACFGDKEIDNINQKNEKNSFSLEEVKHGLVPFKGAIGVALGKSHLCVITAEQKVECLGDGSKGQLGIGDIQTIKFGEVVDEKQKSLNDIWQIKSNGDFDCALKQESGAIWCWGNWKGERWLSAKPISFQGRQSSDFIQVTLNNQQICGIHGVDRTVFCTSVTESFLSKLDLQPILDQDGKPLKKVMFIARGKQHFCALDEDGKVSCWGSNEAGQLGSKTIKETTRAVKVVFKDEKLKKVGRLTAGDRYSCVSSTEEATLFCFGEGFFGGGNSPEPIEYPL